MSSPRWQWAVPGKGSVVRSADVRVQNGGSRQLTQHPPHSVLPPRAFISLTSKFTSSGASSPNSVVSFLRRLSGGSQWNKVQPQPLELSWWTPDTHHLSLLLSALGRPASMLIWGLTRWADPEGSRPLPTMFLLGHEGRIVHLLSKSGKGPLGYISVDHLDT